MFLRLITLRRLVAFAASLLFAQTLSVHAATVIPQTAGDGGPIGIMLEGQYKRFDNQSLLAPPRHG